jgi:hypothetical protein
MRAVLETGMREQYYILSTGIGAFRLSYSSYHKLMCERGIQRSDDYRMGQALLDNFRKL